MFRVTEAKACFLGKSTLGALKPSDLKQLLVQVSELVQLCTFYNNRKRIYKLSTKVSDRVLLH